MRLSKFKKPRVVRRYENDLCEEEPRKNLREIIDGMLADEPSSRQLRKHIPLVPDGENPDDFEMGTRQVLDLVDQQELEEAVAVVREENEKALAESEKAKEREAFENEVLKEVERRMSASVQQE